MAQPETTLIDLDLFRADPRFAGIDGSGVAVVVIDSGIDLNHPFFGPDANGNGVADRIVYSYDFSGDDDSNASDGVGHGSLVASVIASQDATYTGMAPGANIIVLKVFTDGGATEGTGDITEALDWVVANAAAYNVVAVNLSLGTSTNINTPTASTWSSQFASLVANGTAVVAASGNNYTTFNAPGVSNPSADPNAWSIGAVTDTDQIASFSQRSPTMTTVLAPGVDVTGANDTGGTHTLSGTSFSAPVVSGLVADMQELAFQVSGHFLSVHDLEQTMRDGSDTVGDATGLYSRVNALGWGTEILADLFAGTAGDDTLNGTPANDTIRGGAGNDTLNGNAGDDVMWGGTGDDTYYVDNAGEQMIENVGEGTDTVFASVSYTLAAGQELETLQAALGTAGLTLTGNEINNTLIGGTNNDTLDGQGGNDVMQGGAGNDTLDGQHGNDVMQGGTGNDTYYVDETGDQVFEAVGEGTDTVYTAVSYALAAGQEIENLWANTTDNLTLTGNELDNELRGSRGNDTLNGGDGNDMLIGGEGSNTLIGGAGNDTLDGQGGIDVMLGRTGNDTYYVDKTGDQVFEAMGEGTDTVYAAVSYALAAGLEIENLWANTTDTLTLTGNERDNDLLGSHGNDTLNGGDGYDTLNGGDGRDRLNGDAGNDQLIGGRGTDEMAGGTGNDTYFVDDHLDELIEIFGEGNDTVYAAVSYALAAGQEIETLRVDVSVTAGLALTGNEFINTLIGSVGNDTLNGGGGVDVMQGGAGDDTCYVDNAGDQVTEAPGWGHDTVFTSVSYTLAAGQEIETLRVDGAAGLILTGNAFDNLLVGGVGNDTLNGGAGNDIMAGGAANDTYYVDNPGDRVIEDVGEGNDTVFTSVSYTLAAGQEIETLRIMGTVTAGLILTGNEFGNLLLGGVGNDTLTGLDGNDRLEGKAGTDTMIGGTGNDAYVVDNAGDVVTELANQGTDAVKTTLSSYALGADVEMLAFIGTGNFSGTGNGLANILTGGAGDDTLTGLDGNDRLDGKAGADTMIGGTGNDAYVVDNAGDVVTELANEGTDAIKTTLSSYALGADVEMLAFIGAGDFAGTGNTLDNVIVGGAGNDALVGGLGRDKLTGGADADIFQFNAGDSTVASFDTVADFATGVDKMDLSTFAGVPSASAYAEITVASARFAVLKSAAQAQMTGTVQAVFVAATANGWLFWNTDANPGTAEEAVMLTGKNNVTNFAFGDLT
ncbi:hypothetical protein BH10PSE6_BH10PSE6_10610 [soil metagenome]